MSSTNASSTSKPEPPNLDDLIVLPPPSKAELDRLLDFYPRWLSQDFVAIFERFRGNGTDEEEGDFTAVFNRYMSAVDLEPEQLVLLLEVRTAMQEFTIKNEYLRERTAAGPTRCTREQAVAQLSKQFAPFLKSGNPMNQIRRITRVEPPRSDGELDDCLDLTDVED